jgi:hypothetical protein
MLQNFKQLTFIPVFQILLPIYFQTWKKLVLAIRGKGDMRIKDVKMMTSFAHTGVNESLNAHHNKYFTKEVHFG